MNVECQCAGCGAAFQSPARFAGRKLPCPKCGVVVQIPAARRRRPWLAAGAAGAVLLAAVLGGLFWWGGAQPALILQWPEDERAGARVEIDGAPVELPPQGPVEYRLPPGAHTLAIARDGHRSQDVEIALERGNRYVYRPLWQPAEKSASKPSADLAGWLEDLDRAKQQAAAEDKSVFAAFLGADDASTRLASSVLSDPEFARKLERFVPVLVDFAAGRTQRPKAADPKRNLRLKQQYRVQRLPKLLLLDAQGRPFGAPSVEVENLDALVRQVEHWRGQRTRLDKLAAVADSPSAPAEERLEAVRGALELLSEPKLTPFYPEELARWLALARREDPKNERGVYEAAFEAQWYVSLWGMDAERPPAVEAAKRIAELDQFEKDAKFRDRNRAASLHLFAGGLLIKTQQAAEAFRQFEAGLACGPTNPLLREQLLGARSLVRGTLAGTGFAVAEGGLVLTNYHVVDGPDGVLVRIRGKGDLLPARILAHDAQLDLALLQVELPAGRAFPPVPLAAAELKRGAGVLAIGFPTVGAAPSEDRLVTQGIVSATPDEREDGMLVLDCRVNPGNSGGPLCDAAGNVAGMVRAKSRVGTWVDSYGMAVPAGVLRAFLAKHLPAGRAPPEPRQTAAPLPWHQVDDLVAPSVVLVVRSK